MTRIYVGTTLTEVGRWRDSGQIPAGTMCRAVTPEVVAALPDSDDEEREYAVTQLAAEDSLERMPGSGDRLAVLVAEGADTEPAAGADDDPGLVRTRSTLAWREVAAILVEEGGGAGPEEPAGARSEELDLAWYAPRELDSLTRGDY